MSQGVYDSFPLPLEDEECAPFMGHKLYKLPFSGTHPSMIFHLLSFYNFFAALQIPFVTTTTPYPVPVSVPTF
jgi:hypothetical protein